MIAKILTVSDVAKFMTQLVQEGTNAHPDEDFNNYVNMETGIPAYAPEQVAERNRLMANVSMFVKLPAWMCTA
ncbi:hypothetical protein [Mucilaginibacter sp. R-33]|uniref:hypothetical protein n=1 Tax=Mucilaginibacter sp. R-33 TaxID=3416711 RepID=UPI003CEC1C48